MIIQKVFLMIWTYIKSACLIPLGAIRYFADLFDFMHSKRIIPMRGFIPMILDRYRTDGSIDRHYFLQDIYVASKVIAASPKKHFDVGSRVDGFVAHLLAAFKGEVTIIDIRPLPIKVENLNFIQADATNLENLEDCSIESLSSLHAVEHFGLGRYGDKIDPAACFAAMKSLQRVICENGKLYFSVPIGKKDGVYFNSHRIFCPLTILKTFNELELHEFSYIHDYKIRTFAGKDAKELIKQNKLPISDYDCGIFIFVRNQAAGNVINRKE